MKVLTELYYLGKNVIEWTDKNTGQNKRMCQAHFLSNGGNDNAEVHTFFLEPDKELIIEKLQKFKLYKVQLSMRGKNLYFEGVE